MTQKKPSPSPRGAGGAIRKQQSQANAQAAELSELRPGQIGRAHV